LVVVFEEENSEQDRKLDYKMELNEAAIGIVYVPVLLREAHFDVRQR